VTVLARKLVWCLVGFQIMQFVGCSRQVSMLIGEPMNILYRSKCLLCLLLSFLLLLSSLLPCVVLEVYCFSAKSQMLLS